MVIFTNPVVEVTYTEWSNESVVSCNRANKRIQNLKYREQRIEYFKYYHAIETVKEHGRERELNRIDYKKDYYKKNRARILEIQRQYRERKKCVV